MIKLKRILVCAYSCEPGFSSEREIGWKWSNLIAENHETYVLTRLSNKQTIKDYIVDNNIDCKLQFIYYDLPNWARKWKKGEEGLYLYYTLWQLGAFLKSYKIHKAVNFDIVHYVTFGSMLLPHFMALMPTKFVLGPVGGGENVPLKFIGDFTTKAKITELVRHLFQWFQKINPLFLITCYRSNKILVRTKESYKMIPSLFRKKTELMLETGAPEELINYKSKAVKETEVIQIVTVGRFIYSKINLITLKVILDFKTRFNIPFKFIIIGDGAQRIKLKEFCIKNNLNDEVIFTGWVSREEVLKNLSESDIYFSTTFKEGGTWAFFEAVAIGLPIVCGKISGPDMIVADDCGYKIELTNPEDVIRKMADALHDLSVKQDLREEFSINAKTYLLENLTWDKMMLRVNKIYEEIS